MFQVSLGVLPVDKPVDSVENRIVSLAGFFDNFFIM